MKMNLTFAAALAGALSVLANDATTAQEISLSQTTLKNPTADEQTAKNPTAYPTDGASTLTGTGNIDLTISGGWYRGFDANGSSNTWDISKLNNLTIDVSNPDKTGDSVGLYAHNGGSITVHDIKNVTLSSSQAEVIHGATDAIPIHANGGTISIRNVENVTVAAPAYGNAVMIQGNTTNNGSLAIDASGDIDISATQNTVVVGMVANTGVNSQAALSLKGKNITITSSSATALQAYDQDPNYNGPNAGTTAIRLEAADAICLDGLAYGFLQTRQAQSYDSETTLKASNVTIHGGVSAVITQQGSTQTPPANSVTIDAASVQLESDGKGITSNNQTSYAATLELADGSDITFKNTSGDSANVLISAAKGNAVNIGQDATLNFNKAQVSIDKGNVAGEGTMTLNHSRLVMASGVTMNMNAVDGEGAEVVFNTAKEGAVTIAEAKGVTVLASGELNDLYGAEALTFISAKDATTGAEAGKINGAIVQLADGSHAVQENTAMRALEQMNASTLVQFRLENNHLSQRLGEVRDNLQTAGAWARVYGTKSRLSDSIGTDVTTNSIQIGADATVGGNWIVGGAFSYTDMDADFDNGSGESDSYMLSAYASGFFDCGGYVDVIGRVGRMSTDVAASSGATVATFSGSYDNTALGLSAEVGYHWKLSEIFFAEPQIELAYGYVLGDDYESTNGVKVEQEDFQSLVGSVGARIGAELPQNAGNIYLHASVNRDFLGDNDFSAKTAGMKSAVKFSNDLDETWVSYGIGLQLNAAKNFYVYGSLERASGSEYDESYHYSVGGRYVF